MVMNMNLKKKKNINIISPFNSLGTNMERKLLRKARKLQIYFRRFKKKLNMEYHMDIFISKIFQISICF